MAEQKSWKDAKTSSKTTSLQEKIFTMNATNLNHDLPKFSGRSLDWADFKALFTASIANHGAGIIDDENVTTS